MKNSDTTTRLRRVINLPLLTFYGVGVTVGAGIFALIGEVLRDAGDHAPLAFLIAGLIAGATGISYAKLATIYPRAGGEAVYAKHGLGSLAAGLVGYGVTVTGVISSAVIAVAFGSYLSTLIPVSPDVLVVAVIVLLATIACLGVRESVVFAAVITLLEVGTLAVVAVLGAPLLGDAVFSELFQSGVMQGDVVQVEAIQGEAIHRESDQAKHLPQHHNGVRLFTLPSEIAVWSAVLSTVLLAFFAFVGFEDIVNMAEETKSPERNVPRAVVLTLVITIFIYAIIASIAVLIPDRESITLSAAPMASVFSAVSGRSGAPVSAMASIAMVNGILVQIVMASRVIYGMTREGLAPTALGALHPRRRTPVRAIVLIGAVIIVLALVVPLGTLAKSTSLVILSVFTLVNISLWRIGSRSDAAPLLQRWRWWGIVSAVLCLALLFVTGVGVLV